MARASDWDLLGHGRTAPTVTLPAINLHYDAEAEARDAREAAERTTAIKIIRQGRDAWEQIGDANSFTAWCRIGAALHIGKTHALRVSGANCAWGSMYSRAFNKWMGEHGFGAMRPSDRSYAVALHENLPAIEQWRAALPDKQRRRLRGAQQNVKRWRKSTGANAPARDDITRTMAAWRRFAACVRALPPDLARPLWQAAQAQAAAALAQG